ncbi:MAG: glycosyltransferase, partial [Alistipes sp.]|nr:glycosyltransferase [Alistipes sp.]
FALPSRVEGFPMVLIEAMSQGCACLSFQMQGAVNEIMTDGKDGLIVDDGNIERFTQRLDSLMEDEKYRTTLATQAVESVARFSEDCFAQRWTEIIKQVTRS